MKIREVLEFGIFNEINRWKIKPIYKNKKRFNELDFENLILSDRELNFILKTKFDNSEEAEESIRGVVKIIKQRDVFHDYV